MEIFRIGYTHAKAGIPARPPKDNDLIPAYLAGYREGTRERGFMETEYRKGGEP